MGPSLVSSMHGLLTWHFGYDWAIILGSGGRLERGQAEEDVVCMKRGKRMGVF